MSLKNYYKEIIEIIKEKKPGKEELSKLKIRLCTKHKVREIPTDIEILLNTNPKDIYKLKKYLQTKPTRSISGVAVVAVMSKPFACPHGKCIMCPGGPDSVFGNIPQSYTGREPATMRGLRAKFDPYLQVFNRLEQYIVSGHSPEKIELIIMGGTFPSFPKKYQKEFVMLCFKAMNDFSRLFFRNGNLDIISFKNFFGLPGKVGDKTRVKNIQAKLKKLKGKSSLEKEQKRNENSKIRCVGLTIETRPDYALLKNANEMLKLGCTRVELGIQSVYYFALKNIERGHSVEDSVKSIQLLKDLGFKLNFHMMLGLPGVTKAKDLEGLKELFSNEDFMPDMLKLYPCMVMEGTKLHKLWKKGKYKPLTTAQAADIIANFKQHIPKFCRIMRIQRDIPSYMAKAGVDRTNLRQYVSELMKKRKIKCNCIRCREIKKEKIGKVDIFVKSYNASNGNEFFISAEDKKNNLLAGFCRLRFPSKSLRKEITSDSALIRELHVYGKAISIGKKGSVQHKGLGKKLLAKAEQTAKKHGRKKIIIISGIGVREYYRKLGYKKQGPYMVKILK
ncbi:tRNA uridine(34) 5-carboxymethylaminomethyl modification radical SAM/GNAT enzyme Elp3 [Candidatus Woesearchaeota archaeon]|nr:tRNA uridine(34) 5-carboxymethylaminomethyl modification radical SAM/GNAT enzyme Elp3 [Candidatus Woesearchaeota archaeon]